MEIIKTIVSLAQRLKLKLIAEGVETAVQHQMLQALGCELGQGYLWWKPLTKDEADCVIAGQVKKS